MSVIPTISITDGSRTLIVNVHDLPHYEMHGWKAVKAAPPSTESKVPRKGKK